MAGAGGHPSGVSSLGHLFGVSGREQKAHDMLVQLEGMAQRTYVAPFWHAIVHAGLGDVEAAFDDLERSYAQSDVWLAWLNTDPRLDVLRGDSRFRVLARRVGFEVQP
jgi:hypothetical protein